MIICTFDPDTSGYCLDEPVQIAVVSSVSNEACGKLHPDSEKRIFAATSVYNNIDWITLVTGEGEVFIVIVIAE